MKNLKNNGKFINRKNEKMSFNTFDFAFLQLLMKSQCV